MSTPFDALLRDLNREARQGAPKPPRDGGSFIHAPRLMTEEEQAAGLTQEQLREREQRGRGPAFRSLRAYLEDPRVLAPPPTVAPRLAWGGRVTLLAGDSKVGKSTLLSGAAAAVSVGGDFLGASCERGKVAVLCLDEADDDLARRLRDLGADAGRVFICPRRPLWSDIEADISRERPRLLIVDTLVAFGRGHVSDSRDAFAWEPLLNDLTSLARDVGCAVILTHHLRKGGEGRAEVGLEDVADSRQIVAGVDVVTLFSAPSRNTTRRRVRTIGRNVPTEALGFLLDFDGLRYRLADSTEAPALDLRAEVLAILTSQPGLGSRALREACGGRNEALAATVRALIAEGVVEVKTDGKRSAHFIVPGTVPNG